MRASRKLGDKGRDGLVHLLLVSLPKLSAKIKIGYRGLSSHTHIYGFDILNHLDDRRTDRRHQRHLTEVVEDPLTRGYSLPEPAQNINVVMWCLTGNEKWRTFSADPKYRNPFVEEVSSLKEQCCCPFVMNIARNHMVRRWV